MNLPFIAHYTYFPTTLYYATDGTYYKGIILDLGGRGPLYSVGEKIIVDPHVATTHAGSLESITPEKLTEYLLEYV